MADIYNPVEMGNEASWRLMYLNTATTLEAVLGVLVEKEVLSYEEVDAVKEQMLNLPGARKIVKALKTQMNAADFYEQNPEAYMKGLFKAKAEGLIK